MPGRHTCIHYTISAIHVGIKPPTAGYHPEKLSTYTRIRSNFKFISISRFIFWVTFNLSRLTRSRRCYNLTPLNLFFCPNPASKHQKVYAQIPPSAAVNESSTETVVFSIQESLNIRIFRL